MKPILFNTEMVRAILDGRKSVTRRVAFSEKDLRPFQSKDYPDGWWFRGRVYRSWDDATRTPQGVMSLCRYRREDILYVRETWQEVYETEWSEEDPSGKNIRELILNFDSIPKVEAGISSMCKSALMKPRMKYFVFKASNIQYADNENGLAWRPSIHMPKEAARIFLRVQDVHVERVQEMSDIDAAKEGIQSYWSTPYDNDPPFIGRAKGIGNDLCFTRREAFGQIWDSTVKPSDRALYGWDVNPWVWVINFERISRDEALKEEN